MRAALNSLCEVPMGQPGVCSQCLGSRNTEDWCLNEEGEIMLFPSEKVYLGKESNGQNFWGSLFFIGQIKKKVVGGVSEKCVPEVQGRGGSRHKILEILTKQKSEAQQDYQMRVHC